MYRLSISGVDAKKAIDKPQFDRGNVSNASSFIEGNITFHPLPNYNPDINSKP